MTAQDALAGIAAALSDGLLTALFILAAPIVRQARARRRAR